MPGSPKNYDYLRWLSYVGMVVGAVIALMGGDMLSEARGGDPRFTTMNGLATIVFGVLIAGVAWIGVDKAASLRSEDKLAEQEQIKAEEAHRRQLELIDAQKASRSNLDFVHELEVLSRQMAHDADKWLHEERKDERRERHLRWTQLVRQIEATRNTIILIQEELQNNPAAERILAQVDAIYAYAKTLDEDAEIDRMDSFKVFEKIMLQRAAKEYGVKLDGV